MIVDTLFAPEALARLDAIRCKESRIVLPLGQDVGRKTLPGKGSMNYILELINFQEMKEKIVNAL